MVTKSISNGRKTSDVEPRSAYEEAELGFREYWYPVCVTGEVTDTPKGYTLLGDPVMMVRRNGEIFALKDECPHRGTALSLVNTRKNLEFPGTFTTTCAYHGWTFDVRDGKCVAVVSEGPDSPVPAANIRATTYPVEIRRGVVWIWMGSSKPVPVEEDIPNSLLDEKAVVKSFYRVKGGNWRFHAENVFSGHPQMVHKSTLRNWFGPDTGTPGLPGPAGFTEDADARGVTPNLQQGRAAQNNLMREARPYPGLGFWHSRPRWQRYSFDWMKWAKRRLTPRHNVRGGMLILPGITRVPGFPSSAYVYYEWYVPVKEDSYIYFQMMAFWPRSLADRLIQEIKYYFWDRPTGPVLFNNQDAAMVKATTKFYERTGNMRYLTKISPNDQFDIEWRQYCDEFARGVGSAYKKSAPDVLSEGAVIEEVAMTGGGD